MSDWGRVVFYYDYELYDERKKENERGRGFDDNHYGMAELNQAFDTFFDDCHIALGYSDVE